MPIGDHVVYSPRSWADIGPHVFPMEKYEGVHRRLEGEDGLAAALEPALPPDEDLLRVHSAAYLEDLAGAVHTPRTIASELPLSAEIADFFRLACGGTTLASRTALERGWAVHLGGGFHHAFREKAEGFCYLNDLAVAARVVQADGSAERVTVIDLDVHQGNGTAAIFRHDDDVLTASVHGAGNYPFRKEHSDLDFALPDRAGDADYLEAVRAALAGVLNFDPDVTFFVAGADPFEGDRLGRLSVSREGLAHRDRIVLDLHAEARVPVAIVMAGGYATDIEDTVAIHAHTVREAARRQHGLLRFATG